MSAVVYMGCIHVEEDIWKRKMWRGRHHVGESWYTYEWVMAYIWMSHVTHMMRHVTHLNESFHTFEWVMSHMMRHVTHLNESWYTCRGRQRKTQDYRSMYTSSCCCTGWRRLIGSLIFIAYFPHKWPVFSGSFGEHALQLWGSYDGRRKSIDRCIRLLLVVTMCTSVGKS